MDTLQPAAKDYFEWDSELPGFGVRVWPSGRKVYLVQYRARSRSRRVKISTHGSFTVEEARKAAKILLGDIARGEDPAEERATLRKSITVNELCDRYVSAAKKGLILGKGGRSKKLSTLSTDYGRIDKHIKPLLGTKLVRDLTSPDIHRFIRKITAGKTAKVIKTKNLRGKSIVRGGAGTAARTTGLLGGILSFAVSEGVIPFNPVHGVKRPVGVRRQRRLSPDDYSALGEALQQAEERAEIRQAVVAIRLLALTGCRRGEITNLKWSEVDLKSHCLRLEDSKEGASVRPIGEAVVELLEAVDREEGSPFVLKGVRGEGPYLGLPTAWKRIVHRDDLADVTPHTLRHSFASVAADLGYAESTIAALLGHSAGTVTGRYIHQLDDVLISAAENVSQRVRAMMIKGKLK